MTARSNVHHLSAKLFCVRCGGKSSVGNRFCANCERKSTREYEPPKFNYSDNQQQFAFAEEVFSIAQDLLGDRHQHLLEAQVRFEYVFLKNPMVKNGREIWGQAAKVSGLNAWFAQDEREKESVPEPFFVLKFPWEVWRKINIAQKVALVDHELCHCTLSDKRKPALRGHDCEEFTTIVSRHGLWKSDVKAMLEAAKVAEENPLFTVVGESREEDFDEDETEFQEMAG